MATKGFAGKAAYVKGAVWGTPVLAAALSGIEFDQDGMTTDVELIERKGLSGSAQQREGDKGKEFHRGDVGCEAKFETLTLPLAQGFGTSGAPTQQGADTAYLHVLKPANELEGKFGTLVLDYQHEVHEYPSCKVGKVKFEINQADMCGYWTFSLIADALNRNTGSGTNKTSTISGITMAANRSRLLFNNLTVRLNDQDGGALGNGDKVHVTAFSFELDRQLKQDDVSTERGYLISEPQMNGFTMVKGSLTYSQYNANNLARFAENIAKTQKKMDAVITGPVANGATNYRQSLFFNNVQFESGRPNMNGPGLTGWTSNFKAHLASAAPTGFPLGYTDAVTLELINTLATDPQA